MRPLKLKMTAFGSYIKPVTLDFEENLRGEKIFLINGVTGAGKTTILDAICFALYGTASGEDRDGVMMRSKGISDDIKTEVEFSFALDKKIYEISRTLSYYSRRKANQYQFTAELKRDGQIIGTQTRNVTNLITELLGFDAKQFRQVVLLPQGEFTNFLKANSSERQPILDALFNADLYNRIEVELKRRADDAQKVFDDLNRDKETLITQLQGANLDEDIIKKLRADLDAAQKKSAELKKIFDEAQEKFTTGKILAGDFAELERRKKTFEITQKKLEDAKKVLDAVKIEYDRREGEQSKREELKSTADKLVEIKKSLVELEDKRKTLTDAEKKLKSSTDALKNLEDYAKKCDALLSKLKTRRSELSGAEKRFAEAQTTFKRAEERKKIQKEIAELEHSANLMRKQVSAAEEFLNEADIEQKRLEKLQMDGSAARLAKNLREGEPCPVCGSRTHYAVDFSDAIVPSDKEIDNAKAEVERRKKIFDGKRNSTAAIEGQLISKREELKKFSDIPADDEEVKKIFDSAKKNADEFADCEKRIVKGEICVEENKSALDAARDKKNAASNEREKIFGALQTLQAQIDEKYLSNPVKLAADLADIQKTLRELENAWKNADKNFRAAEKQKSSCEGAFTAAQKSKDELDDKIKGKTPPDVDALKNIADSAQKNFNDAIRTETSLKNSLESLEKLSAQIIELDKKISAAEKTLRIWKRLSDAANGKISGNKLSFARYYLDAMFEQVLTEANYRLEKMSDRRYSLKSKFAGERSNSKAGLNLEIFDDYTGETRPVATLSGGESFLASLSLALGLAAVVRNNLGGIKLDTIFIDEGFGSLDSETLDDAISTITEHSGGRLVGIISHVEELKNQIPVRLEVTTSKTGSTAKFIS